MNKSITFLFLVLGRMTATSSILAFTPPPGNEDGEIVFCYFARAVVAGVSKCDPPSTLVGSVYGGCSHIEDKIRQDVLDEPNVGNSSLEMEKIADIAINRVHSLLKNRIEGWILDVQASEQSVCHNPSIGR